MQRNKQSGRFSLLANPNVFRIFIASMFSIFGEGIFYLTCVVLIQSLTGSVIDIGYMIIISLIPSVIVAPLGGVFIDRFNKAQLAKYCCLLRLLAIFAAVFTTTEKDKIFLLYAIIFVAYLAFHLLSPTVESMLKEHLTEHQYVQGVSFLQAAWQIGLFGSTLIGGYIVEAFGIKTAIIIACLTYGVGVIAYRGIDETKQGGKRSSMGGIAVYFSDIAKGWQYLLHNKKILFYSLAAASIYPFMSAFNILIVPLNYEVLKGGAASLGILGSGASLGSLISAFICLIVLKNKNAVPFILSALSLMLFTYLFSQSSHTISAFGYYVGIGLFVGNIKVISKTVVMEHVDMKYMGRVMATISMISLGLAALLSLIVSRTGGIRLQAAFAIIIGSLLIPILFMLLANRWDKAVPSRKRNNKQAEKL